MALSSPQLLLSRDGSPFYSLRATNRLESGVEDPLCRNLDGVVEHVWEERNRRNTQLRLLATVRVEDARVLTPIGPQVLSFAFLMFFLAYWPEYRTMLWMVNAGNPILATLWNTALCAATALQSSMAGTRPGATSPPVKLLPSPTTPPAFTPEVSVALFLRLFTFSKMLPWATSFAVSGCRMRWFRT